MIPPFNASGVIPPFAGGDPTERGGSPYKADLATIAARLATTDERKVLLRGLIRYRLALKAVGIVAGFQLIDGSFTEDCETSRQRPPKDIDVVTFAYLPVVPAEVAQFTQRHPLLFSPDHVKETYHCDAYFVDLAKDARLVVADSFYWYGLFSHQRTSYLWKGCLQLSLAADDEHVLTQLGLEGQDGPQA